MINIFCLFFSFCHFVKGQNNFRASPVTMSNKYFLDEVKEWKEFSLFEQKYNKNYETLIELEKRFQIFKDNLRDIIIHNLDSKRNFSMGINQFTDLTSDEFREKYITGLAIKKEVSVEVGSYGCKVFSSNAANAPVYIDWRAKGAVTSVKDQGQCGSCWTFSSTGAIEGAWAVSKRELVDLSEQQLVDCATGVAYGSHGCNGGQMDGAFKYVIQNGQCALTAYPYTAKDDSCNSLCSPVVHISSCFDVKPNDQLSLKGAVAQQPVAIAIEADTRYFQSYSSGILTSTSCGTNLDHGVLIAGYGEENGQKYWLVKNSWGTTWGENGYVKIARSESTNDAGICGIAMDASFPVV